MRPKYAHSTFLFLVVIFITLIPSYVIPADYIPAVSARVKGKAEYEYVADTGGNQDGVFQKKEDTHLENVLNKLLLRLTRFKHLPQSLRGMSMNLPERMKKYGIFLLADKSFQRIKGKNQLFISTDDLIQKVGDNIFSGSLIKYDKHLDLKSIWILKDILIKDEDNWEKLSIKKLNINYYALMRSRRGKRPQPVQRIPPRKDNNEG